MASSIQYPGMKLNTIPVMVGPQKSNKSFIAQSYGALFGRYFSPVRSIKEFENRFNAHMEFLMLVLVDECGDGAKRANEALKKCTTEASQLTEHKHRDTTKTKSFYNIIMCTDQQWACAQDRDARRPVYFEPEQIVGLPYFPDSVTEMKTGGLQALMYLLKNRPIADTTTEAIARLTQFRPAACMKSLFKDKLASMKPVDGWIRNCLIIHQIGGHVWNEKFTVSIEEMLRDYKQYNIDIKYAKMNLGKFREIIKRLINVQAENQESTSDPQARTRTLVVVPSWKYCLDKMAGFYEIDPECFLNPV
jgi:hypothetical protein